MAKYDVFISFKKTDAQGLPTKDCEMARALYNALDQHDIPTFFSEKLRSKGEANFKKAIERALSDARLLVAVGTTLDNMEAPWVDKEISTFELQLLNRVKDPATCTMVSYITPDFPPAQLPSGLSLRESFTDLDALVDFILTFLEKGSSFVDQEAMKKKPAPDTSSYTCTGYAINGRYEILKEIGRGGFSQIFKVKDLQTQQIVAAKVVSLEADRQLSSDVMDALLNEANIMQSLDHPQIPKIHEVIRHSDLSLTMIMDLVEGTPLDQYLVKHGRMDEETVCSVARQLGEILHYLHTRPTPIIYRDVKPANIILTPENEVVLLDFGIARRYHQGSTADTTCLGTSGYAPTEQYGGMGQTDARTDIYALGITLYQLLTCDDPRNPSFAILPLPHSKLSHGLDYIIRTCTQHLVGDRFQSAAEFLDALNNIQRISRRERWKNLFQRLRNFRFRKPKPVPSSQPSAEDKPYIEETGILNETHILYHETTRLSKEAISSAEVPRWTSAMLKDATLKFRFDYHDFFLRPTINVKIDDVFGDGWNTRYPFSAVPVRPPQVSSSFPPSKAPIPVGVSPATPGPRPICPPQAPPIAQSLTFTCDVKAADQLSITFENDSLNSDRALHFLWIGKPCHSEHVLRPDHGKKIAVTLWKNGEKVLTKVIHTITAEEKRQQTARARLRLLANESMDLLNSISYETGIHNNAPREFVSAYYKTVLTTQLNMGKPQPVMSFLFLGNPDTGKSITARAIAKALGRPFAQIQPGSTRSQANQQMDMLFFLRRSSKPLLLFEEIEKADRSILQFLRQLMSGSIPIESGENFRLEDVIIIVTTCSGAKVLAPEYLQSPVLSQNRILEVLSQGDTTDDDTRRFPKELLDYTGWQKLIHFPPQTSYDLRQAAENELYQRSAGFRNEYGIDITFSNQISSLILFSGDGIRTNEQVKDRAKDLFLEIVLALFNDARVNSCLTKLEQVDVQITGEAAVMGQFDVLCQKLQKTKLIEDCAVQVPYTIYADMCDMNRATVSLHLQ